MERIEEIRVSILKLQELIDAYEDDWKKWLTKEVQNEEVDFSTLVIVQGYEAVPSCEFTRVVSLDKLGREVEDGDVVWNRGVLEIAVAGVDYRSYLRCPGPGQLLIETLNFRDWHGVCLEMQRLGALFQFDDATRGWETGICNFLGEASQYRRDPNCTWKGPK